MSGTPRQRRAAAAAATRRWRRREAAGIRLVPVEVGEARLARLVADGSIPAEVLEDSARLGALLGRLIENTDVFAGPVTGHAPEETYAGQGFGARDAVTAEAGARSRRRAASDPTEHAPEQGRDRRGRWLRGTSGNPRGRVPEISRNRGDNPWLARLLEQLLDDAPSPR